jgi:REP element-mobilizing transposase RayT
MLVVAPPQLAPAKLVQFLKGRSSRLLQQVQGMLMTRLLESQSAVTDESVDHLS